MSRLVYRKKLKHYNIPGHAHLLTFSCYRRLQLLLDDRTRYRLAQSINEARIQFQFDLWAWVFMPEHVHLLVWPRLYDYTIDQCLKAIKAPVARREIAYYAARADPVLNELTITQGKRTSRRLWQCGGGHDTNLSDSRAVHNAINYIHRNPVERKLCRSPEDWIWSSARDWAGLESPVFLKVDRTVPMLHSDE